jgi:hypothetical protein
MVHGYANQYGNHHATWLTWMVAGWDGWLVCFGPKLTRKQHQMNAFSCLPAHDMGN